MQVINAIPNIMEETPSVSQLRQQVTQLPEETPMILYWIYMIWCIEYRWYDVMIGIDDHCLTTPFA